MKYQIIHLKSNYAFIEKITLENLGNMIGKSKATVSKYENGEIIPDITTVLEICNVLNISLSELIPIKKNNRIIKYSNPFNKNVLYLYYYTEKVLIESILNIIESTNDTIIIKFYNGIKDSLKYMNNYSYYYEGEMECSGNTGYIDLCNPMNNGIQHEKVQITFNIPWTHDFYITNFFISGLTPNSLPVIKKGIISLTPLKSSSNYLKDLLISDKDLNSIKKDNAWILSNANFDKSLDNKNSKKGYPYDNACMESFNAI